MNNKAFTISVVIALLAVLMVHSYVTSTEEAYKAQYGQLVSVVVSKRNIKELEILDETNLAERPVPKRFRQPGAISKLKSLRGTLAIAPILKGEQITRTKVTQLGARTGLSRQVGIGKRAFAVQVSDITGVGKLIKPGDRVDVIALIDVAGGNKALMEVKTVLQDIMVLSVGKYITNSAPGVMERDPFSTKGRRKKTNLSEYLNFGHVSIEVDPYQAQQLVFLTDGMKSALYLSLRNNDDNVKEDLSTTGLEDVLGQNSKAYRRQQRARKKQPIRNPSQ